VTTLLIDALIALVKLVDRGMSVVEKNVRLRADCPVADAHPAGVGRGSAASANPGGDLESWHPSTWPDSELLGAAAELLCWLESHPGMGPRSREGADNIRRELNLRAAKLRAERD
jgi:hypothetical protein